MIRRARIAVLAGALLLAPVARAADASPPVEGRDFRELAFTDPDGHLVVLYQLD